MTSTSPKKYKILILGAGSGGISVAARLRKTFGASQVALIDPAQYHYYQPLWTLVGAGVVKKERSQRNQKDLIPKGVDWIQDSVESVDAKNQIVTCQSGTKIHYEQLVVATGLKLDFHKIKGLQGNLGKHGICSIYQYQDAEKTAEMIQGFKGGHALFTMPPVPIKCAGAPQKIMYLADEVFRKNGIRHQCKISFATAGKVIFGVPSFAKSLMEVVKKKDLNLLFSHKLVEVKAAEKIAVFEVSTDAGTEQINMPYDLLHVVPPMSAHEYIQTSQLAFTEGAQSGWLKVDQQTLQHLDYPNIFGIGDVTGVPNSKTGAAIRKQAPVVVQNICDFIAGRKLSAQYDGYSSCPLVTGHGKVILAEFGYDGKLMPSFPMDMTKERRSMWILKKDLLPTMYWKGMLKGRM